MNNEITALPNLVPREKFLKLWNPENYNWIKYSWELSRDYSDFIDIWWDPNKYDWEGASGELVMFCKKYIHIWWDPEKFNWKYLHELMNYCREYFDIWWTPEKIKTIEDVECLCEFCGNHINKWFPDIYQKFHILSAIVTNLDISCIERLRSEIFLEQK